jgi:hypothetical protein
MEAAVLSVPCAPCVPSRHRPPDHVQHIPANSSSLCTVHTVCYFAQSYKNRGFISTANPLLLCAHTWPTPSTAIRSEVHFPPCRAQHISSTQWQLINRNFLNFISVNFTKHASGISIFNFIKWFPQPVYVDAPYTISLHPIPNSLNSMEQETFWTKGA